ncbi:MAG: hypothetical protein CVU64_09845 [Deltaproteobacteria bacterium HGW-Deltaproteobacteria-21]|nr:MAG: hypothetical protein CVU64_09845 [Deltaproteobacteria bacterium HGW-Deltaproteobacteria-21]
MPEKPSEKEEEYFARIEFEKKKKLEHEKHLKLAAEEKKRLKELHYMRCPKCGMELVEVHYKGIAVDKCSECEGVWLDYGEFESASRLEKSSLGKLFSVFKR